ILCLPGMRSWRRWIIGKIKQRHTREGEAYHITCLLLKPNACFRQRHHKNVQMFNTINCTSHLCNCKSESDCT
ncbi:hypothetical protein KI387_033148, partial [Taxus chinensis]